MANLIGEGLNQVPVNGMLGNSAFMDSSQLPISDPQQVALDLLNSQKQPNLGFTAVQQGTGIGQGSNTVKIGWSVGSKLKVTVDSTDLGNVAFEASVTAAIQAALHIGEVRMWHGAVANIATVWGPGWQLADGTNGTANLKDKFIVGAGNSYAVNATGGVVSTILSIGNLPSHNHPISDPGHVHSVADPGHAHSVYDPGHVHGVSDPGHVHGPSGGDGYLMHSPGSGSNLGSGGYPYNQISTTAGAYAGISIAGAITNIGIYGSGTGVSLSTGYTAISTTAVGSATAFENRPPFYALAYIEYVGP